MASVEVPKQAKASSKTSTKPPTGRLIGGMSLRMTLAINSIGPTSQSSLVMESSVSGADMKELPTSPRVSRNCKTESTMTVDMRVIVMTTSIMIHKTILL